MEDYAKEILAVLSPTTEKLRPYTAKIRYRLISEFPDIDRFDLAWFCGTNLGAIVTRIRDQRSQDALNATLNEALGNINKKAPR